MRILILKMGTTEPVVVERFGDYDDWFRVVFEGLGCEVEVLPVFAGAPLPDSLDADALVLTGSPLSVRDEESWMAEVGQWTLEHVRQCVPVLAICFGHQLIGECLGSRVEENPKGPEWGSISVEVAEDPLFRGLPSTVSVQASHRDVLTQLPEGACLLASNANTEIQAYGWGEYLRAIQFHPEASAEVIGALLSARGLPGAISESDHGVQILSNWVAHWVQASR
jgi:GMP synthase (glutamine-hydrolysing)